jgi:hypothetical protein
MDVVTLYNLALHHIGGTRIQAVDEGGNADVLNDFLQVSIDNALEKYDWGFARDIQTLTYRTILNPDYDALDPNSDQYIPETWGDWSYVFDLPDDFLALRNVKDHEPGDYETLMTTICSNQDSMRITYTSSLRIVENFPNPFSEALAYLLAYNTCTRIVGFDAQQKQSLLQFYDASLRLAMQNSSRRQRYSIQGEYTLAED